MKLVSFINYNENTGQINHTGICPECDLHLQGVYIKGTANDSTQYIQNKQIVDMPPKPDGSAYFDYNKKQWILNYPIQEEIVKKQRDEFFCKSDWTQIPNGPLTIEQQQSWAVYRQELRDITSQPGYPFNVVWPTQPE